MHNKTRHDWAAKFIHWESCKKLKFDHTTKCYLLKPPESVLEKETPKILWNFEIQTKHQIPSRRHDLVIKDFAVQIDDRVEIKESQKID